MIYFLLVIIFCLIFYFTFKVKRINSLLNECQNIIKEKTYEEKKEIDELELRKVFNLAKRNSINRIIKINECLKEINDMFKH